MRNWLTLTIAVILAVGVAPRATCDDHDLNWTEDSTQLSVDFDTTGCENGDTVHTNGLKWLQWWPTAENGYTHVTYTLTIRAFYYADSSSS